MDKADTRISLIGKRGRSTLIQVTVSPGLSTGKATGVLTGEEPDIGAEEAAGAGVEAGTGGELNDESSLPRRALRFGRSAGRSESG